jgi:hypothetical protein
VLLLLLLLLLPVLQARLAAYQEALSELVMYKSRIDVALLQVCVFGGGRGGL